MPTSSPQLSAPIISHLSFPRPPLLHAALKSQLEAAEQALDKERRAHQSTKMAAAARERDLEAHLQASGSALADTQRALEEVAAKRRGG